MKPLLLNKLRNLGVVLKAQEETLNINAPEGVLTKELIQEIKENKAELIDILSLRNSIPNTPLQKKYPLTSSQRRLWVLSQFDDGNKAYNIPGVFKLKGALDIKKLEQAFKKLIERHESLRTYFKEDKTATVYQHIKPFEEIGFNISTLDISDKADQKISENQLVKQFYQKEFNLEKAPLVKAKIIKQSKDSFLLLFAIHHIIGDGWSMEVLTKELMVVYNNLIQGQEMEVLHLIGRQVKL